MAEQFSGLGAAANPVATGVDNGGSFTERKSRKAMSDEDFAVSVKSSVDDAVDYIDGFIAPNRALALGYYQGDSFGNEEEGRSQIVMTEVRDTVLSIIPSLLRIFTQSSEIVQFTANTEEKVELAEQQTDYINHVFYHDNPGFDILYAAFRDALVSKTGIIKWRWSDDTEISAADFQDLDIGQVAMLKDDPFVTITKQVEKEVVAGDDISGVPAVMAYDVSIRRVKPRQRCVLEAIPPEEFLISRSARDVETAAYVGHRSMKTRSDLVAMGYDPREIDEYASQGDVFVMNYEAQARNPAINSFTQHQDNPDPSMQLILYVESYVRIDKDGDGIAELRKVCSIGNAHHVLHDEIATDTPFALFCPVPEPHMVIGQSVADQTMDLQRINSNIVRGTLDSLALSITPRGWFVEGQVNADDIMNTEIGAQIRMRQPGMAGEFTTPFVGQSAMPILAYMSEVKSLRTGVSAASQGLNPDVLQSTTKAAVDATVTGAQERTELIARLFAESGMKRLFKGLLKMVVRHQDKPRTLRLRGKWVEVDPRYWDADLDVSVDVALGKGTDSDKMQFLMLVAQKQEQIIQLMGPDNPLAPVDKYRNTLAQICNLAGFKDASKYFGQIDPVALAQKMQQAQQNKPQDPTVMLAQIESQKVQQQGQKNQAEAAQKQQQMHLEDQREREKMRLDAMIALAEIEAKYGSIGNTAAIEAAISRDEAIATGQIQADAQRHGNLANALSSVLSAHISANAPQQQAPNA